LLDQTEHIRGVEVIEQTAADNDVERAQALARHVPDIVLNEPKIQLLVCTAREERLLHVPPSGLYTDSSSALEGELERKLALEAAQIEHTTLT